MPDSSQTATPSIEDEANLKDQLTRAWNLRSSEDQVLWRIFGTFWPTNAILLVALFRSGGPSFPMMIITCVGGLFVAVVWFLIQRRALGHIQRLESVARRIEVQLRIGTAYALCADLNKKDCDSYLGSGPMTRSVMPVCVLITGISWLVGLGYSIYRTFSL
jgi:hypothetical protein